MAMAVTSRRTSTLLKIAAAVLILLLAFWVWRMRNPAEIAVPQAQARAEQMLAAYRARSGEPVAHFAAMARVDYPEGWEFSWAYAPCPDVTRLRVFIRRNGSGHYGELPDCHPMHGFGPAPARV